MDPVSAVSFAATILTFVDFSWNLVKGSYQAYQSATNTTADDARLSTILADLEKVRHSAVQYNGKQSSPRRFTATCSRLRWGLSGAIISTRKNSKRKETRCGAVSKQHGGICGRRRRLPLLSRGSTLTGCSFFWDWTSFPGKEVFPYHILPELTIITVSNNHRSRLS